MQGFYKVLAIARTISLLHMANTDDPLLLRYGSVVIFGIVLKDSLLPF